MINLEQIKLLESKIAKTVDYVERVTRENAALLQREAEVQARLEAHQKRIDELEALIIRFREEQGQIEDGILSALDRLSRFEEEMEKGLKGKAGKVVAKDAAKINAAHKAAKPAPEPAAAPSEAPGPDNGEVCFEIPENGAGDDINDPLGGDDPLGDNDSGDDSSGDDDSLEDDDSSGDDDLLEDEPENLSTDTDSPEGDGELDIF